MFEDRVDLWDVTLRVRRDGTGPPVLLLHGHAGTLRVWDDLAGALAGTHTVVRPDLRGYGGSPDPPGSPNLPDSIGLPSSPGSARPAGAAWSALEHEMVLDCLALMHSLGHDRFAVIGQDLGGHVAVQLAAEHPTKIDRVVVIDAVPTPPPACRTLVLWSGKDELAEALLEFLGQRATSR